MLRASSSAASAAEPDLIRLKLGTFPADEAK